MCLHPDPARQASGLVEVCNTFTVNHHVVTVNHQWSLSITKLSLSSITWKALSIIMWKALVFYLIPV